MRHSFPLLRAVFCWLPFLAGALDAQRMQFDETFDPLIETGSEVIGAINYVPAPEQRFFVFGYERLYVNDVLVEHAIARINADGSLDTSFVPALAQGAPPSINGYETVTDAISLSDGRVLVVTRAHNTMEAYGRIVRLLADGRIDPSFSPIYHESLGLRLALLSDGSAIAWGQPSYLGGSNRNGLARILPDGTVDPAFAPAIAETNLEVTALVVTPDDRIVFSASGTGTSRYYFQRLTREGAVDPSFHPAPPSSWLLTIRSLSDNRLLVIRNNTLERLNADGTVDSSFSVAIPQLQSVLGVKVLPNDRLALEAVTNRATRTDSAPVASVFVLTKDGALELDCRTLPGAEPIQTLRGVRSDGAIAIVQGPMVWKLAPWAETSDWYTPGMAQPRLSIVNPSERTITDLPTAADSADKGTVTGLSLDPSGRILVEGSFTRINGIRRTGLARLDGDGNVDPTFVPPAVYPLLHLPDGRIIGSRTRLGPVDSDGFHSQMIEVVRINTDGTLDPTFVPTPDLDLSSAVWLLVASDGRILVCAFEKNGGATGTVPKLVWLAPDGSRDATLGTTFPAESPLFPSSGPAAVREAAVLENGQLLVRIVAASVNGTAPTLLVRLNADGSTDPSYRPSLGGRLIDVTDVKPSADGRAFVVGTRLEPTSRQSGAVLRLNPDGAPDTFVDADPELGIPLADGSFLYQNRRYHADGAPDLNFDPFVLIPNVAPYPIRSAVLTSDGILWFVAYFNSGNPKEGVPTHGDLARLLPIQSEGFTVQPSNWRTYAGLEAKFQAELGTNEPATFQWTFNGNPIPGATNRRLYLAHASANDAGDYRLIATAGGKTFTSDPAKLMVNPTTTRVVALSGRSRVPATNEGPPQIGGFIVRGDKPRPVLLRAVGLGLRSMLPADVLLTKPLLRLFRNSSPIAEDIGGIDRPDVAEAARLFGAFPLPDAGDGATQGSALLLSLEPGLYTAHTSSADGNGGINLFEIYDADANATHSFASGISLRGHAGVGGDVLILGFVIQGDGLADILIRGSGPDLTRLGVPNALADPQVTLFNNSSMSVSNDNWQDQPDLAELNDATQRAQLTSFASGSRDAALHVRLPAGIYTVHGGGVNGATGEMLLEIYTVEP